MPAVPSFCPSVRPSDPPAQVGRPAASPAHDFRRGKTRHAARSRHACAPPRSPAIHSLPKIKPPVPPRGGQPHIPPHPGRRRRMAGKHRAVSCRRSACGARRPPGPAGPAAPACGRLPSSPPPNPAVRRSGGLSPFWIDHL